MSMIVAMYDIWFSINDVMLDRETERKRNHKIFSLFSFVIVAFVYNIHSLCFSFCMNEKEKISHNTKYAIYRIRFVCLHYLQ